MSPVSKAQQKAVAKYMKNNYDEIKIRVDKGIKDEIYAHAQKHDKTLNGFIKEAIGEKIKRDKEKQRKAPKLTPPDQMKLEDINRDKESHK